MDIVVSVGVGRGWRGINDDDTMDLTPMADIVGEMAAPEIAKYLSKADAQDPGCVWNAKLNLATQRTLLLG